MGYGKKEKPLVQTIMGVNFEHFRMRRSELSIVILKQEGTSGSLALEEQDTQIIRD